MADDEEVKGGRSPGSLRESDEENSIGGGSRLPVSGPAASGIEEVKYSDSYEEDKMSSPQTRGGKFKNIKVQEKRGKPGPREKLSIKSEIVGMKKGFKEERFSEVRLKGTGGGNDYGDILRDL